LKYIKIEQFHKEIKYLYKNINVLFIG